jgi:hypothetical protein
VREGTIEPHAVTEQRQLARNGPDADLLVTLQREPLATAYRRHTHAVVFGQSQV